VRILNLAGHTVFGLGLWLTALPMAQSGHLGVVGAAAQARAALLEGVDALGRCGVPVVGYDADLQQRAAAEADALAEGSALAELLSDYAVMRDQARACAR
jgi:hypothetical protein